MRLITLEIGHGPLFAQKTPLETSLERSPIALSSSTTRRPVFLV